MHLPQHLHSQPRRHIVHMSQQRWQTRYNQDTIVKLGVPIHAVLSLEMSGRQCIERALRNILDNRDLHVGAFVLGDRHKTQDKTERHPRREY